MAQPGFGHTPLFGFSPGSPLDVLTPFSPPWEIVPTGDKYCVVVKESQENLKCHDTEADAQAHLAALYVNVQEASFQAFGILGGSPYHIELFGDGEIAQRALAGEPILVVPLETFHDHWGDVREVDAGTVEQFVDNWNHRLERGIRREKLAVDIDHKGGAVGWYKKVMPLDGLGVGASFDWTHKGRAALESGEYAYFSPTLYWRVRDRITGDVVENQLAGGALTNYPYFGEATALMSWVSTQGYSPEQQLGNNWARDPRLQSRVTPGAISGGFDMADQDENAVTLNAEELTGLRRIFSLFGSQGQGDPPASSPANGFDPAQIEAMSDRLETLEASLSTVTDERDQYRTQVTDLTSRLGSVEVARQADRFANLVASDFNHLPGEISQLASGLMWMFNADREDDEGSRPHYEFFTELMRRADSVFAESFNAQGDGGGELLDEQARIDKAVSDYQEAHPEMSYEDAMAEVFNARPELSRLFDLSVQRNVEG